MHTTYTGRGDDGLALEQPEEFGRGAGGARDSIGNNSIGNTSIGKSHDVE